MPDNDILADMLERQGHHDLAAHFRDYAAAHAYFGTSATYVSREAKEIHEMLDKMDDPPCSAAWVCEHVMVALWRTMGRPTK